MKLAEALILRADRKRRIEQVKQRLVRNAKVQEGDEPAEIPASLVAELEELSRELLALIQQINRTNSSTTLERGGTISDAIAERDILAIRHAAYRDLAQAAAVTQTIGTRSEIKFKSTVRVPEIQAQADAIAKAYRELDTLIQEMNWRTELLQ